MHRTTAPPAPRARAALVLLPGRLRVSVAVEADRVRLYRPRGELVTVDQAAPDWRPLERLFRFDPEAPTVTPCSHFMHMGTVTERLGPRGAPVTIQLYKHSSTRRYLNLDAAGNAYAYDPGGLPRSHYYPTDLEAAMCHVADDDPNNLRPPAVDEPQ